MADNHQNGGFFMIHTASVFVSDSCSDATTLLRGKGQTKAEALAACLAQIGPHIEEGIELSDTLVVPEDVAVRLPQTLPEGHGLLILERCSHSSGNPYDHRFFAVRYGTCTLQRDSIVIGGKPVMYSFLDCNADYEFPLPEGSMEFVEGQWTPCAAAKYDY